MTEGKTVGAVVSAVQILRHLSESRTSLASNRVARDLGLNPSTCFNILKTLEGLGLAWCDPESKRYRLGLGLIELSAGAVNNLGYKQLVRPHLERLAQTYGVAMTLWLRSGEDRAVLVDLADGGASIQIAMTVGQRQPILTGAFGRCFAAHLELGRDATLRLFKQVRWQTAPSFEAFMKEAAEAKAKGYAIDRGNFAVGINTVSSVVFAGEGHPIMALSAVMFANALNDKRMTAIARDLKNTADTISHALKNVPDLIGVPSKRRVLGK